MNVLTHQRTGRGVIIYGSYGGAAYVPTPTLRNGDSLTSDLETWESWRPRRWLKLWRRLRG